MISLGPAQRHESITFVRIRTAICSCRYTASRLASFPHTCPAGNRACSRPRHPVHAVSSSAAGAGGTIWGLYFLTVSYNLGFRTGLIAFTSAVFGGIGNIPGAALGGLVIGLVAAFSDFYIGSKWTQVVIFGILIAVLVFRPTGLLGMRVPEK